MGSLHTADELLAAIDAARRELGDRLSGVVEAPETPVFLPQIVLFIDELGRWARELETGTLPPAAVRRGSSFAWHLTDSWSPRDPLSLDLMRICSAYARVSGRATAIPDRSWKAGLDATVEAARAEVARASTAEAVLRTEACRAIADRWAASGRPVRRLPHDPPLDTLESIRAWTLRTLATPPDDAVRLANASLIAGLVEYAFGAQIGLVREHLRRAADATWQACQSPNTHEMTYAWMFDRVAVSVAVGPGDRAAELLALPSKRWSRPWLDRATWIRVLALRHLTAPEQPWPDAVADAGSEDAAMLTAVRAGDELALHEALEERGRGHALRFRDNRLAPVGLIDLHALAYVAVALRRGLAVRISDPYLPLELLDE